MKRLNAKYVSDLVSSCDFIPGEVYECVDVGSSLFKIGDIMVAVKLPGDQSLSLIRPYKFLSLADNIMYASEGTAKYRKLKPGTALNFEV